MTDDENAASAIIQGHARYDEQVRVRYLMHALQRLPVHGLKVVSGGRSRDLTWSDVKIVDGEVVIIAD